MKYTKFILAIILLMTATHVFAQKTLTEGTLKYKVEMSGITDPQAQAMMENMTMSVFIKNSQFATLMDMGIMTSRTVKIDDNKFVTLMDMMGQRYKITMDAKQYESRKDDLNPDDYTVTVTGDTKVIAGYNCKKAIIKTKEGKSFVSYFTEDIKPGSADGYTGPYSKVNGLMMEYSMEEKGNMMTMTCISVDLGPVNSEMLTVPTSGYTELTLDQLIKMGM